jgi:hypothetical protein
MPLPRIFLHSIDVIKSCQAPRVTPVEDVSARVVVAERSVTKGRGLRRSGIQGDDEELPRAIFLIVERYIRRLYGKIRWAFRKAR